MPVDARLIPQLQFNYAVNILNGYVNPWYRFFPWRMRFRNHVAEVNAIIARTQNGEINDIVQLMAALNAIQLTNPAGSLARCMADIQRNTEQLLSIFYYNYVEFVLMRVGRYPPEAVESVLQAINTFPDVHKHRILSRTNLDGLNALMLAARKHPEVVEPLLEVINILPEAHKNEILSQTTPGGSNALMLAARNHPEAVKPLLQAINALPEAHKNEILSQTTPGGSNALMLAALNHPEDVETVFEVINILPEAHKNRMLSQIIKDGLNILMMAARYHPEAVEPLLQAIHTFPEEDKNRILSQTTPSGWNALMRAARFNPDQVKFLLDCIDGLDFKHRQSILLQVNNKGENALDILSRLHYRHPGIKRLKRAIDEAYPPAPQNEKAEKMAASRNSLFSSNDSNTHKVLKNLSTLSGVDGWLVKNAGNSLKAFLTTTFNKAKDIFLILVESENMKVNIKYNEIDKTGTITCTDFKFDNSEKLTERPEDERGDESTPLKNV